jgi:outer membrane protein
MIQLNNPKNAIIMKNKFVLALLVVLLSGMGAMAQTTAPAATPIKIGFASVNYILSQMPEYKQIEKQLEEFQKKLEAEHQKSIQDFQTKVQNFEKNGENLTVKQFEDTRRQLQQEQQNLENSPRLMQIKYAQRENELLGPAFEKIQNNIDVVAKENNFSHVLNSEVAGTPTLLYVSDESNDISDLVLKKMGITPKPVNAQN